MRPAAFVVAAAAALAYVACARGGAGGASRAPRAFGSAMKAASPPRPSPCTDVPAGAHLQSLVDRAADGAALCLAPGNYAAPLTLTRPITVWGTHDSVVRSAGKGTTVSITGHDTALLGVTVSGSGHRYDLLDSAVHVDGAEDVRVEGVVVDRATFGVMVDRSRRVTVRDCDITGLDEITLGLRGDGIRFWETTDSVIDRNHVVHARDVVVWYSARNTVTRNVVERGRYGSHLMYSSDNVLEGNRYVADEVGIFVMYSRNVRIENNLIADGTGAAGMGIGVKESGNMIVERNRILHDTVGIYLDNTPLREGDTNLFEKNIVQLSEVAVTFHSSQRRNTFRGNAFRDNQTQVRIDGGGDALSVTWSENDFDDYAGYDMDGDGFGDVPYEPRSLSGALTDTYPEMAFFHGSPTLAMLELAGRVVPMYAPRKVLVDLRPSMHGPHAEASGEN